MRVLSLHNFAKYGCFISINDKIINNLLRWGRFQPNFRRPLGKTMDGTQKSLRLKMMARTTSITMQNFVEIARRTAREDEMRCFSLFLFITGISFTHRPILGVFAPQGRHVAPIKVKFGREEVRSFLPNLTLIGSGVGVYGPQN